MAYFNEFPHTRTYDSDLGWLIKHVKKLLECCDSVQDAVNTLNQFMEDIENGNFPDSVVNAFKEWMRENLTDLVGELIKGVYFGLTQTGYFVAYIPDSWNDIIFNTSGFDIDVPEEPEFGHLILSY